jgi:carboxypeptidase C (cathepsin A)
MTKRKPLVPAALLAIALIGAAIAHAAQAATGAAVADRQTATEAEKLAAAKHLPEPSTTSHGIQIDGRRISYRTTAATLPVGEDLARPEAHLFYVAYVLDEADPATRPVAFVLNGGPGASAAYLHLGGLGPWSVVLEENGAVPPAPPRLVPNPDTWLTFTDLVFIDPVETGFSRGVEPADGERDDQRLLGTEPDLEALSEFIRLWLGRHERWASPKFLVGESYGGFRVAALADMLAEQEDIQVNGAVLISPVLEFSLHDGDAFTLLPWVLRIPSFVAVAREHGKMAAGDLEGALDEAEAFGLAELLPGLARGDALDARVAEALYQRLADLTGLRHEVVRRHAGRIPRGVFAKELLRADGRVVSLYDGSMTAIDPEPDRDSLPRDARLTRLTAALGTAINDYLRRHLDYETDKPYRVLNRRVSRAWNWRAGGQQRQGFIGAADDLKAVLSREPTFRVLIVHGAHDLVTPYFTSVYVTRQMRLDPQVQDAVRIEVYEGGHMFYTRAASRARLHEDARRLFESAKIGQREADAAPSLRPQSRALR